MLKEFWDKKKYLIQIVGYLTAIGALFLNIPMKDNQIANNALLNIQFFWILIITVCVILLLSNIFIFLMQTEKYLEKRLKVETDFTISLIFFILGIFFLFNLWKYTTQIYFPIIKKVYPLINAFLGGLIGTFLVVFDTNLLNKWKMHWIARYLLLGFIGGFVFTGLSLFYKYSVLERPIISGTIATFSIGILLIFLVGLIKHFYKNKKTKVINL
jgi:cytochrome c biogenesis protein CcdA